MNYSFFFFFRELGIIFLDIGNNTSSFIIILMFGTQVMWWTILRDIFFFHIGEQDRIFGWEDQKIKPRI